MPAQDWEYNMDQLTDDEAEDYDAEEPEKVFHYDLSSRIKEKFHHRLVKMGIPRKPGFYRIQTCRKMAKPSGHFYTGKHWEMAQPAAGRGVPAILQKPLERTTRRLTICAINNAIGEEQNRRIKTEARELQLAGRLLSPLNKEFKQIIAFSQEQQEKEESNKQQGLLEIKDTAMAELLHRKKGKEVDTAMEEERQRRMTIMAELTDESKSSGDAGFREMLRSLSKVSKVWQEIQNELSNAAHDLDEVHEEEDHAVGDIFNELRDEFVLSFKRATLLMKFHMAPLKKSWPQDEIYQANLTLIFEIEENERQRRLNEAKMIFSGKKKMDNLQRRSSYMKDLTQQELLRVFNSVRMSENEKEEQDLFQAETSKGVVLEELMRRHSIKEADHSAALERARRIQEVENDLAPGSRKDPIKEHIKDIMLDVQEQMLLQIFHGHKIRVPEPRDTYYHTDESPQDRKLRNVRMQSRRKSCVVTGF